MKVLFPRNIPKWMFSMHLTIGPLTITIVQMFILAMGAAVGLAVFNGITKQWEASKLWWIIASIIVILIFVFIAFFKISEMWLVEFSAKFLRTYFFDEAKKYQTNYRRFDETEILLAKHRWAQDVDVIESKQLTLTNKQLEELDWSGLL